MRQYKIDDMGGCSSFWWAEDFTHALEQFADFSGDEEPFSVMDMQLNMGVEHANLWDYVYSQLLLHNAMPENWEDESGTVWDMDNMLKELTHEEKLLINAMESA